MPYDASINTISCLVSSCNISVLKVVKPYINTISCLVSSCNTSNKQGSTASNKYYKLFGVKLQQGDGVKVLGSDKYYKLFGVKLQRYMDFDTFDQE